MKPYGIKRNDRWTCSIKGCLCGDMDSKHPKHLQKNYNMTKRLKHSARQEGKKERIADA